MSSTSKLARQMTMIIHSIFTEFFITDVTKRWVIINQFIVHCYYHTFWELNLLINFFDVLFKCVYQYLRNIIIVKFFYKSNWLLRKKVYRQNALCGNNIHWGYVSDTAWCCCSQGLVDLLIACEGLKICIYNRTRIDLLWFLKRYFRSLFEKFNFYSFVWFTILRMRC